VHWSREAAAGVEEEAVVEEVVVEEEEEDRRPHLTLTSHNNPLNKPKM